MINTKLVNKIKEHIKQNYILNGGKKMYKYTMNDDITNQVTNIGKEAKKKKQIDQFLGELDSINKKFSAPDNTAMPQDLSLERKVFEPKSREDIASDATEQLEGYKNTSIKNIADQNKLKEDQLYKDRDILSEQNQQAKEAISSYYDTAKENASNEALKRGLARSSIIINQLGAFDQKQIDDYNKLDREVGGKIEAINFELQGLDSELKKALADFNITYAVNLQDKINQLTTNLKEQEAKVVEYNNEIALKEAEFNKKLTELKNNLSNADWDKGIDMLDVYGKYGSNVVNKYVQDNLYNATKTYLNTLSSQEALEVLSDENVKKSLGNMYSVLLKEFGG